MTARAVSQWAKNLKAKKQIETEIQKQNEVCVLVRVVI